MMFEKRLYPGEYQRRDRIRVSTREYETDGGSNPGEYRRIQDRKDRIWKSTGEEIVSKRVSERGRIRVSTGERSG